MYLEFSFARGAEHILAAQDVDDMQHVFETEVERRRDAGTLDPGRAVYAEHELPARADFTVVWQIHQQVAPADIPNAHDVPHLLDAALAFRRQCQAPQNVGFRIWQGALPRNGDNPVGRFIGAILLNIWLGEL